MPKHVTDVTQVLPPVLTREGVDEIESKAVALYGRAQTTSLQFAMELRQLQDGEAHRVRGYPSFGPYVEHTFEGISATNAKQISRTGHVLLLLEQAGRIDAYGNPDGLPGVTGVRALATILGQFGEDAMLAVYDEAAKTGRKILDQTVKAAMQGVIQIAPTELGEGADEPSEPDEELDEDEQAHEMYDRFGILHEMLHDMADKISEGKDIQANVVSFRDEVELLRKEAAGETDAQWLETGRES